MNRASGDSPMVRLRCPRQQCSLANGVKHVYCANRKSQCQRGAHEWEGSARRKKSVFANCSYPWVVSKSCLINFTGEYPLTPRSGTWLMSILPSLVTAQEELFEAYKIKERSTRVVRSGEIKTVELETNH